jgi:oligoribonuclease NrnB/cAMP/cGMP phosphodiesterase (DHH superfamily)
MKPLVIYHGNCLDGFSSLWVVNKALNGEIEPYAGFYNQSAPDVKGRHVIIVDFSYKRPILLEMAKQALSVLVLDHHNTAQDELKGLPTPPPWDGWAFGMKTSIINNEKVPDELRITALFDMKKAGVGVTWDYFFKGEKRPKLIDHIEDRDLWKFALPYTEEINAFLFSYPYDLKLYDDFITKRALGEMIQAGMNIKRKHHKDVAELVAVSKREMIIDGYKIPVANLPYTLSSDAGHFMAKDQPFAACYFDTAEGRVFSLRSSDNGLNVGAIARKYGDIFGNGGGGHIHSSGFTIPYNKLHDIEDLLRIGICEDARYIGFDMTKEWVKPDGDQQES